jgi:hypothetical protein
MTDETFDLRHDLAEVPLEEDNAYFTLNMKLLREVRALRAKEDVDEDLLAAKEAELKAASYTAEMMWVPLRRREDIYEEALDLFVPKVSFIPNQVDEKTAFKRGNYVRIAIVAAGIKRLISPSGAVQEENIFDTIEYLHDKSPEEIFETLEAKGQEINEKGDIQSDLHKDADF